jgi:hypothetical protein
LKAAEKASSANLRGENQQHPQTQKGSREDNLQGRLYKLFIPEGFATPLFYSRKGASQGRRCLAERFLADRLLADRFLDI